MGTAKIFPEAQNIFPHPSNFPFFPFCFFFCLSFVFFAARCFYSVPKTIKVCTERVTFVRECREH